MSPSFLTLLPCLLALPSRSAAGYCLTSEDACAGEEPLLADAEIRNQLGCDEKCGEDERCNWCDITLGPFL